MNAEERGEGSRKHGSTLSSGQDYLPPLPDEKGLELLRKSGFLTNPFLLLCPGDETRTPVPLDEPLTPDHCSYRYTPPLREDSVILQDREGNHPLFRHQVRKNGISAGR